MILFPSLGGAQGWVRTLILNGDTIKLKQENSRIMCN